MIVNNGVAVERIAQPDTWAEVLVVLGKERVDLIALEGETIARSESRAEDGHVLVGVMERTFIVVANSVVHVELWCELEGVAGVEEPGIDEDLALGISDGDAGGRGLASQEVGERITIAVQTVRVRCRRNSTIIRSGYRCGASSIEGKGAGCVTMVELVQLCLPILSAEAQLVLSLGPGELIGEVPGDVVASLWRRKANGVKIAAGGGCAAP